MKTIVLISCVSKKLAHPARAKDLYTSALFRLNLAYAERLQPDVIFILSAKHGLLRLDEVVEPYDVTLNKMRSREKKEWAELVLRQLRDEADLDNDRFIFLAGRNYRQYLLPHIRNYEAPLEGLTIGRQLSRLKQLTA